MPDRLRIIGHFIHQRCRPRFGDRDALRHWQEAHLARLRHKVLRRTPFYRHLGNVAFEDLPIMSKALMMEHFDELNTANITADEALGIALRAERERDFSPLCHGVTVGLSSGTSGVRGLFLVSDAERAAWAGTILARLLRAPELRRLLQPWRTRLQLAFFLRANSNLYTTLNSRRLAFRYYDLLSAMPDLLRELEAQQPDILVAPASVLHRIARAQLSGGLSISPRQVISVAEVMEPDDEQLVRGAFHRRIDQIYQCTEGLLGFTCEAGGLHLNETQVLIEPEWLDADKRHFRPLVTDFTRRTQAIVRYRMNDILRVHDHPCACGRVEMRLAAIDGRDDDVLWLRGVDSGDYRELFPDLLRRAISLSSLEQQEYAIRQMGDEWRIALELSDEGAYSGLESAVQDLCRQLGLRPPAVRRSAWTEHPPEEKRRRIRCVTPPEGVHR